MRKTSQSIYDQKDKGRVVIILLLFISATLNAQFYEFGQDAGQLKWYQFSTPHYRVIYPRGVDSTARIFANRLEYFYPHLGKPLDHKHRNIPVIIHNESSFSNGVVAWVPKRLEIFTNPDPNGYPQDWLTQLALHEGRHAVQIDKLNQGFTRALSVIGGEQVVGAMAVFLPYWYLEGDAVDAETRLSNTGRGRLPSFEMEMKAQLLDMEEPYSFSKATMGSYRDYIPNHYKLGYLMVRYGRMAYGDDFWIDFQQYAARKPFLLDPTYFSMRKYDVRSKRQFYNDALSAYRHHWAESASDRSYTPFVAWQTERSRHYTSYSFPCYLSDSLLFAYKTGMDQIPEFIFAGMDGNEKRIFRPGILSSGRVSFSGRHVVWDEFVPDPRWSNRNYSVIRTYEVATGTVKNLGQKTRYYAPSISKDGSRIAAVEQTELQQFNLVVLDLDGAVERSVRSPQNLYIQHPAWMNSDSALILIVSDESGKSLYRYSTRSGAWDRLWDAGYEDISHPVVHDSKIFFSGTFSGIDNIYCLDLTDQRTYQVTSSRLGAFYPQISDDGKHMVYADYSAAGYTLATMELDKALWRPLAEVSNHAEQLNYTVSDTEAAIIEGELKADSLTFTVQRYRKALHLFNFHSWLPLYVDYLNPSFTLDPEDLPVSPGLSLISQNHLSTAVSQLAYEYSDGYHMFHSGIKLTGRYPVLNLYFDYGGEPDVLLMAEGDSVISVPNDLRFTAQTYVPLRLNTGKVLSVIRPRIDYSYRRDVQYVENRDRYTTGAHYLYYNLYAAGYLRRGRKDILPRIGMTTIAGYYHAPFNNQVYGAVATAAVTAYVPGILKHQTIKLAFSHQKQFPLDLSRPAFINLMGLPRGLHGIFGEVLTKYSADYVFPVLYPDLAVGPLIYIKRIRAAVWGDHLRGTRVVIREPTPHYENRDYTTLGVDLVADLNILRIPFPLAVGTRIIYDVEQGSFGLEWIYSIDIP